MKERLIKMNQLNIVIFGLGYVGMSLATLLGTRHSVNVYDIDEEKMLLVANGGSTIDDPDIQNYLDNKISRIKVGHDIRDAVVESDYCIIATPTNFDSTSKYFDTSSVDECISKVLDIKPSASIIVKSTIPVGFIKEKREQLNTQNIVFCPEFLQEGTALRDNLKPERIVVGSKCELGKRIADLFLNVCANNSVVVRLVDPTEAECVKLFANNYLAMRVAFFNELDSFAHHFGLNSEEIITGICSDKRIGNFYNNPSFGFGGYCLPKDVSQLTSEIQKIPDHVSPLLCSLGASNFNRKSYIARVVNETPGKVVGIYRINTKAGSSNFRESAIIDVIRQIQKQNKTVVIYEPLLNIDEMWNCNVVESFDEFNNIADIIVANRKDDLLLKSTKPLISRDIFQNN